MGRVSDAKQRLLKAAIELMWENSYGSLTVDQICVRAQVKKGSFYYFFESKTALAEVAITTLWENNLPEMDATFSATKPPLERLRSYFEHSRMHQQTCFKQNGKVLGCPYFTVGSEVCLTDQSLAQRVQVVMDKMRRYFESAIRDAQAEGSINVADTATAARCVIAFFEGLMTQARIQNNPAVLDDLWPGIERLLGVADTVSQL